MCAEKKRMPCRYRAADVKEVNLVEKVAASYTSLEPPILTRTHILLVAEAADSRHILLAPPQVRELLRDVETCARLYTAGLHIASIVNNRLHLHLSLGQLLEPIITRNYVILPEALLRKLLYGKPVTAVRIEYAVDERVYRGEYPAAILSEARRFSAWARVEKRGKGKLLIKPVIDVGWYLRSGV